MNFKFSFLISACLASNLCFGLQDLDLSFNQNASVPEDIVINNRILLKINGKPLTVMDVVKKMDMLFYRQYPEFANSNLARFQYYTAAWRMILGSVVDDALIVADAKEKAIEITDGEVREELEKLFGPDVVLTLDSMDMTLEEAFELLKTELTVQRMNGVMVRSKAITEVNPKQIRERYEEKLKESPPQKSWVYQVLSVKGSEHEQIAQKAYQLITEQKIPFEKLILELKQEGVELILSEEFQRDENSLSLAHKAVLQTLSAGACSSPITRGDATRIFCLKQFEEGKPTPFNDMADKIRSELIQESVARLNKTYREKLRAHYGLSESYLNSMIPEQLEPFAMK